MVTRRNGLMLISAALLLGAAGTARTVSAQASSQTDESRLALKGYDPVAYFTEGRPTPGNPKFESIWDEARYRFASDEHMAMFRADPEHYVPQYEGHCAGALALGLKIEANPESWLIKDGRLFVFAFDQPPAVFTSDEIAAADKNWKLLKDAPIDTDLRFQQ
ncbi:MAG TPA: YHS domain-containing (seleno)protein [Alphaproteobacteria bacterium]|nr:YHS domain-containing (seleno)protein [Alphaproteobacteria bacterium]